MGLEDKKFGLKDGGLEAYRRFLALKGAGFNASLLNRPVAYRKAFRSCRAKSTGWDRVSSAKPPGWNEEEWRNCKFEIDHLYGLDAQFKDLAENSSFLPKITANANTLAGSQVLPFKKDADKTLVGPDLLFNGHSLSFPDQSITASSGLPGIKDYRIKNKGPIPPGVYSFDLQENDCVSNPFEYARRTRFGTSDWGNCRIKLHPEKGANTFDRSGFYLHGGMRPGSAGCIDVGINDRNFLKGLSRHGRFFRIIVDYDLR